MIGSTHIAAIVFNGGPLAWLGVCLALIGGIASVLAYRRRPGSPLPVVLRLIALALLALCLAEPSLVGEEADPGANIVAVLADNSAGMQIRDAGERETRGEQLAGLLQAPQGGDADWLATIADSFSLRRFAVDAQTRRVGDFESLDFAGRSSALGAALDSMRRRFAGRPVAGVLLLSDGNATDEIDLSTLDGLPPVYPVVVGGSAPERDLGIRTAAVSQTSFEDSPVTVRADVQAQGYRDKSVEVRLLNSAGDEIETQLFVPPSDADTRSIRFLHRPPTGGVQFYRIEIAAGDGDGAGDAGEEATELNNSRLVTLNRGAGPYRVLYLCGRPNWEYKFLNRALAEDAEVELVGLIRVARREPKFQWRGRDGVASNQLFQGLDPNDDTADTDQPVLVRINARDGEFASGFPRKAEDLFEYRAVIIDDLERAFFSVDQMDLLDAFVSRRGGSLLMLGGIESFAAGGYEKSPLEKMLPVHVGSSGGAPLRRDLKLDLTRDGWLSPWMRLRETEADEGNRIDSMPPFRSLNRVAAIKPGATVLANVDDGGVRHPALVAQRFGKGRVGALMLADVWRWGFGDPERRADMEKAWRQLVRWSIADVGQRLTLELTAAGDGAVKARVEVKDEGFEAMADARVKISLAGSRAGAEPEPPIELVANPSDTEPGVFEVTFVPHESGSTTVTARASDAADNDKEIAMASEGWATNDAADEFVRLEPNRELLEAIAKKTGGEVIEADALDSFAARLPKMGAPETRIWSRSLWHTPLVFLVVLGCFAAEWILRRRAGMA